MVRMMKFYKCITKAKALLIWAVVLMSLAGFLVFSKECKDGGLNGVLICLGVLVPSLFPFMVLASFIGQSGISLWLAPLLNPISRLLTGMRGITFVPVLLSVIGGYPVGAHCTAEFFKQGHINHNEAEKLSYMCCCAGPGFIVNFVGISIYNSKETGLILLSSQIISIAVLCILSRIVPTRNTEDKSEKNISYKENPVSEALVSSVSSAVKSCAGMCGFVIMFSVICAILTEGLHISGNTGKSIISFLEITSGVSFTNGSLSLEILSAFIGFGGICVHLQIFRELKYVNYSKARFYIFRFAQAAINLLCTKILLIIFPLSQEVFSNVSTTPKLTFYSSIAGCIALAATSVLFILTIRNKRLT